MENILELATKDWPLFLLVFFRISGVMMFAPVFGSAMAPATVKVFLSVVLALLLFPLAQSREGSVPMDGSLLAIACICSALARPIGSSR